MFLLAGNDIQARLRFHDLFSHEHYFYTRQILRLNHRHQEEPPLSSALHLTPEYVELLTTGRSYDPPFSPEFPAQRLTTAYEWDDLVLDLQTRQEIEDIAVWVRHQDTLMNQWMLWKRLKLGYRSLFYGSPGTGKTMTASLLGKTTGLPVYRIDLSKVVSKYIGETEKNLASLFDYAQNRNWILFFDEADSLFGKRTETRNANDRAANQQVSYLLQRIEDFPGVVILATNLRSHLDEAFARRFQSMIHFPMPSLEQRRRLWDDNFKDKPYRLAPDVDLRKLAHDYEISGGTIINVLRYACLKAVVRTPQEIRVQDLLYGIRKELHKEGKFLKQHS
jgi:SpoVK/Ycf46/Vps4 family AAA+-type ATPase